MPQTEYQKKYWQNLRQKVILLIEGLYGDKCILCGSKKHIEFHEIHGRPHPEGNPKIRYMLNHYKDFVPLCVLCHRIVHHLGKVTNEEKLRELMSLLEQTHGKSP